MNKEKAIENIIENFDFERVCKVMKYLDWKWRDAEESPSIGALVIEAQKQLSYAFDECLKRKKDIKTGTGGFVCRATYDNSKVDILELVFELDSWDYYEE